MLTIRRAGAEDVSAVLSLWQEAGAEPSHTDDPVSLARLIEHDVEALILAESNGRIVGSVISAWDGWRGSIYRLVVAVEDRRNGIGRRLVAEAEARFAKVGARRLQAIVVESDDRATSFWRTSGWEQQAERLRFVKG